MNMCHNTKLCVSILFHFLDFFSYFNFSLYLCVSTGTYYNILVRTYYNILPCGTVRGSQEPRPSPHTITAFGALLLLFQLQKLRVFKRVKEGGKAPKAVIVCGEGLGSWDPLTVPHGSIL